MSLLVSISELKVQAEIKQDKIIKLKIELLDILLVNFLKGFIFVLNARYVVNNNRKHKKIKIINNSACLNMFSGSDIKYNIMNARIKIENSGKQMVMISASLFFIFSCSCGNEFDVFC